MSAMPTRYDLVIIGTGTAAMVAAMRVRAAGWHVASSTTDRSGAPVRCVAATGVAAEQGRLKLTEYLQNVSNPAVYAAGDAVQKGPPLTQASSHYAKVIAANLLEGNHHRPDYRGVPSVAFTIPLIAAVGLSERDARAGAEVSDEFAEGFQLVHGAPGRAESLRLQRAGGGGYRVHPRRQPSRAARGRGHQPVCPGHSPGRDGRGAADDDLRVPDRCIGHRLYARAPRRWRWSSRSVSMASS